jgi:uncharacterized protein YuzE
MMQYSYDEEVDVLDIRLRDGQIVESDEVEPGMIVDFDASGNMLAIEILHASFLLQSIPHQISYNEKHLASSQEKRVRILRLLSFGKTPEDILRAEKDVSVADIQDCLLFELRRASEVQGNRPLGH